MPAEEVCVVSCLLAFVRVDCRRAWCLATLLAAAVAVACGGGGPLPPEVDQPTVPTPIPPAPTPHPICAAALAQTPGDLWPSPHPARSPAAVISFDEGLKGFAIDGQTGSLTRMARLDEWCTRLVVAPAGDLAYCLEQGSGSASIQALRVDGAGGISEIAGAHIAAPSGPLLIHPTRRLLYHETVYRVSPEGILTPVSGTASPSLLIHPNGVFAYEAGKQYCIDTDGIPREVASYAAEKPGYSTEAVIGASGHFLVLRGGAEFRTYRIDAQTGLPTLVGSFPQPSSYVSTRIVAHPTRNLLYLLGQTARDDLVLETHEIDANTGSVTLRDTSAAAYSYHASGLEIDPGGRFLYVWRTVNLWEELRLATWRIEADGKPTATAYYSNGAYPIALSFFAGPPAQR
jgi:hypothetical protein